jgi:hypothetical protein
MRVGKAIIIFGTIVFCLGIIFHFQGQGFVGPESSFMYSNPEWVTYGLEIMIVGIVILAIGIGITKSKKV